MLPAFSFDDDRPATAEVQARTGANRFREHCFIDAALDTLPDIFLIFDQEGRFLRWNARVLEVTGYAAADFARMHPLDFFDDRDAARVAAAIAAVKATGTATVEAEILTRDGSRIPYEFNAALLHDDQGEILGICTTGRDVSARKRAEILQAIQTYLLQLIAGGRPLREILETLVCFVEEHRPGVMASILLAQPGGATLRQELGPSLPEGYAAGLAAVPVGPACGSCGTAAFRGAPVFARDVALDPLWTESRAAALAYGLRSCWSVPIFDLDHSVLGTFALYQTEPSEPGAEDIRVMEVAAQIAGIALQHHRSKLALQESEERFRRLLHSVDDVVWAASPDASHVHFVNPATRRVYGIEPEAFAADPWLWFEHVHPDDQPWLKQKLQEPQQPGQVETEFRIVRPDGEVRWVHSRSSTVYSDGRAVQIGGLTTDITERKHAEEALQRSLEKERELNEMKSRFVSMVSHELRTPLATIQASAELVERFRERWDAEKIERHLGRIQRNVHHMTALLEEVLFLGRADARALAFSPESMDLHGFVEELVDEMRLGLGRAHVLALTHASELRTGRLDRTLLRNILHNLLANAFKYSDEGTTVTLHLDIGAAEARFRVTDHGIGVPPEDLPCLFEPFQRASNVGSRGGTGLGLVIVKRAVELHGGRIHVESTPGRGTTCEVVLPYSPAASV